jgi:hypothetical protein
MMRMLLGTWLRMRAIPALEKAVTEVSARLMISAVGQLRSHRQCRADSQNLKGNGVVLDQGVDEDFCVFFGSSCSIKPLPDLSLAR